MSEFEDNELLLMEKFEYFNLSEEQIKLYRVCRKDVKNLSMENLILLLCCKKLRDKIRDHAPLFKEIIDKYNYGQIKVDKQIRSYLDTGAIYFDPEIVTKSGHGALFLELGKWKKPHKTKLFKAEQMVVLLLHQLLQINPKNVTEGISVVVDCRGVNLDNFNAESLVNKLCKKIPIRIRKIYMFHSPWYLKLVRTLIRPFLSKKMNERIVITHEKDLTNYFSDKNVFKRYMGSKKFNHKEWLDEYFPLE